MTEDQKMEMAQEVVTQLMQRASFEIGDLINEWPNELRVFWLASAQTIINSLLPTLDERDRKLFDSIIGRTTVVMVPSAFDPRSGKRPETKGD